MDKTSVSRISSWIEENGVGELPFLSNLIQQPSVQGKEAGAQAIVEKKFRDMGLAVDVWNLDRTVLQQHPAFHSDRVSFDNSPNVVGIWKGTGGGRSIILNGHIDVVPAGDTSHWELDPFSGHIIDGKMYGRGTSDMKGGIFSAILAVQCLQELGVQLQGDVILQSVVEEESSGSGSLATILRGYTADACLIPEPTNLRIFASQQGSMWFRIKVPGLSAHGGSRYEGVSAIEKGTYMVEGIKKLEEKRNDHITNPLYSNLPIAFPINVGIFHGGEWPSSVPDSCVIEGRIGVAPHETLNEVQHEAEEFLLDWSRKDSWLSAHPITIEWFGAQWRPSEISVSHELSTSLIEGFRNVLQGDPIIQGSPWGTDAGFFSEVSAIPTIVFGPGRAEVAHFPNEYIAIQDLLDASKVIAVTLMTWCGISHIRT